MPDLKRPWGSVDCESCPGFCAGHFLTPEEALKSNYSCMSLPPSRILKDFLSTNPQPSEEMIDVARRALLPVRLKYG